MKYDPKIIIARFNSKCNETGKDIKKGTKCLYYPLEKKVYSLDSKTHEEYLAWYIDINYLGQNY